jgi:hypothetical protein
MPSKSPQSRFSVTLEPKFDYWGQRISWPFNPNSMKQALKHNLSPADSLLGQAAIKSESVRARPPFKSVKMEHFQEGDFQLIFKVHLEDKKGREGLLCAVVAKSGGSTSRVALNEFKNLRKAFARSPEDVVEPLCGGFIDLPPAAGKKPEHVFVYFTPWLPDFHELGVNADMNLFINEKPFHTFKRPITEEVKKLILECCLRLYDPGRKSAMVPPLVGAGDVVITRPARNKPLQVKLITVRKFIKVESLAEVLKLYLEYEGEWGDRVFRLAPERVDFIEDAAENALNNRHGIRLDRIRGALRTVLDSQQGEW